MKNLMNSEYSDEKLIYHFLNGDSHCFGILYSRYFPKVYAKCYSFSRNGDDAFDMTQEILLKVYSKMGSFEGNSKFSTWLYSISTNYCITYSSKRSRKYQEDISAARHILDDWMDVQDFEERLRRESLESKLDHYLKLLSEEERQFLVLKYRMNYSVKDLQKKFDLSASAVKMRLLRARTKIHQLISLKDAA
jgi:RNA polymerase sigma-70 factor (ECF subfamily)